MLQIDMFFDFEYKVYRANLGNTLDNYNVKLIEILHEYIKECNFEFQVDIQEACTLYLQDRAINLQYWVTKLYKDTAHPTYVISRTFLNFLASKNNEAFFYMVDFLIQKGIIQPEKVTADIQKLFAKYR